MKRVSSLRVRLLGLVALALLPAVGVIVYTAEEQRRAAIADVQTTALRVARLAATDQGRRIAGARELLVALAHLREVRLHESLPCSRLFARVLEQYPLYLNLGAVKPDGELFCSALPVPEPTNLADRAYVRRALAARDFAVGDYQVGRVTRQASVNVAYPVVDDDGTARGVVFAAIGLASLNQLVAEARLPEGSTLTVIDRQGTVLVRHPHPERWVGKTLLDVPDLAVVRARGRGIAEAAGPDGIHRLLGFVPLLEGGEAGDVYVSVGIPRDAALTGADRLLARNLGLLALVGLLATVAAWYGGEAFVVRPVRRLVEATRRLAAGDLTARVGVASAGELGQLAGAFDEMAEALRAREAEIRRSNERLLATEKLAALGRLAAGVAHELRNPLTVIHGRLQLLRAQLDRGAPPDAHVLGKAVGALGEATERMKRIMQGLANYSRPARVEPVPLDVRDLPDGAAELVSHQARTGGVRVAVDVPDGLPPVLGDRSEMAQILVNLATNALEAMAAATGGVLTLAARLDPSPEGGRVRIEVADTGPGIPPEQLERIWEPFVTTKAEGTGLGLSIVRGLTERQPGAAIAVESTVGRGTTFRLTMPVAPTARGPSAPVPRRAPGP